MLAIQVHVYKTVEIIPQFKIVAVCTDNVLSPLQSQ